MKLSLLSLLLIVLVSCDSSDSENAAASGVTSNGSNGVTAVVPTFVRRPGLDLNPTINNDVVVRKYIKKSITTTIKDGKVVITTTTRDQDGKVVTTTTTRDDDGTRTVTSSSSTTANIRKKIEREDVINLEGDETINDDVIFSVTDAEKNSCYFRVSDQAGNTAVIKNTIPEKLSAIDMGFACDDKDLNPANLCDNDVLTVEVFGGEDVICNFAVTSPRASSKRMPLSLMGNKKHGLYISNCDIDDICYDEKKVQLRRTAKNGFEFSTKDKDGFGAKEVRLETIKRTNPRDLSSNKAYAEYFVETVMAK